MINKELAALRAELPQMNRREARKQLRRFKKYRKQHTVEELEKKEVVRLKAIRDIKGIVSRNNGDVFDYMPWDSDWQGMTEQERFKAGILVHCFGQGEFEVLRLNDDVILNAPVPK